MATGWPQPWSMLLFSVGVCSKGFEFQSRYIALRYWTGGESPCHSWCRVAAFLYVRNQRKKSYPERRCRDIGFSFRRVKAGMEEVGCTEKQPCHTGFPKSRQTFWEKEEQWSERFFVPARKWAIRSLWRRVHRDSEHRIVTPTIQIHSLKACGLTQGNTPEYPYKR